MQKNCSLCPRLVEFRQENEVAYPSFFNGAVPSFGDISAEVLVVGLAPGLKGANQTGRPFTGDYAGDVLYKSLLENGFASGDYKKLANNGLTLQNIRITNAVRCVPPQNKPEALEINTCNQFLIEEMKLMQNLKIIISLGGISHKAVISAFKLKQKDYRFGHDNQHQLHLDDKKITFLNSYHCSRYNINTGRLSQTMFDDIICKARNLLQH